VANLATDIAAAAEEVISLTQDRAEGRLDYSEDSLETVEQLVNEDADAAGEMTEKRLTGLANDWGCYILEVARRKFGGKYYWSDRRDQPVLVVGEPKYKVALMTFGKVKGRLSGATADDLVTFYQGFADRVRRAKPGDNFLHT
jgi:hypothetical protein